MKTKFGEYVRLARGFFGCSSFWRGNGHYLYVKGSGFLLPFSEEYHRFEFLKIQSVAATRTSGGTVWSILCGVGAVISGALTAACVAGVDGSPSDPVLYVLAGVLGIAALICLAVIAVNIVMGPTCVVRIQTAVRAETVRPLSRWRSAREILSTMQVEIALAQTTALRKSGATASVPVPASVAAPPPLEELAQDDSAEMIPPDVNPAP
ncbi:MAG: hypothetical protein ACI9R3_003493 [Verrucomicrobiales bacterium]|jgi:hypothetical protein